tara:strand:- start:564 stop:1361 length:798 start_codon:yes stop_codon:yes gene_type:complete
MIYNEISEIIKNEEIADNIFEAHLSSNKISRASKAGQFINILPEANFEQTMRRPMSISYQDNNSLKIIYKAIGVGTKIMKKWEKGDKVDIIGPLGNCWDLPTKKDALLIGGGVGIAPILNLFNSINTNVNIDLFIGARYGKEHFLKHNPEDGIYLSTDNGEIGIKGNLFDAINEVFSIKQMQNKTIYVCGPPILMERIRDFSIKNSIECYLALETIMACGIGICQGCTLEMKDKEGIEHSYRDKYKLVCIDGPIFNANEVKTCFL